MKEFKTLSGLQDSKQTVSDLMVYCRENLLYYIVQDAGYTATGDDVTFANGRVGKAVFIADAKSIKTVNGNVQDELNSIVSGGLPSQSGNEFKFLSTDGSNAQWTNGSVEVETFAGLEALEPVAEGLAFVCQERANAKYILQPISYIALPGDVTFANGRVGALKKGVIKDSIVRLIPTDYANLQDAVDDMKGQIETAAGARIRLLIESGHTLTSGLYLSSGDYSDFILESEDDVVLCNLPSGDDLFRSWTQCSFPIVNAMFDMQGTGSIGFYAANNSKIMVTATSTKTLGVKNAGFRNVMVYRGSWASIGGKQAADIPHTYTGAGDDNIFCSRGSWCFANNCILTGAGQYGIHSRFASHVAAYECDVRGSTDNNVNCSSGGTIGMGSTLYDSIDKLNPAPETVTSAGFITGASNISSGVVNIIGRFGDASEGIIEYSDGSRRFWKYIEVDSTSGDTQTFTLPSPVPTTNARIYLSGAAANATSPVVGSGVAQRGDAAASVVYGAALGGDLGVRVTSPSSATENTIIGYMATVDINAMPNAFPLP